MSFTEPSSLFIAIVLLLGGLLFWVGWLQMTKGEMPFRPPAKAKDSFRVSLQRRLRKAGMVDTTAGTFTYIIATICILVYVISLLVTGSLYAGILLWPVIVLFAVFFLSMRERSYIKRASNEIVPFLRKIESQVRSGRTAQAAFIEALEEAKLLRVALEKSLFELRLNRPFAQVLKDTHYRLGQTQ